MAYRFDVMSVRADDKGAIVVGMVLGAQARPTVVLAAGFYCRFVESVDLRPVCGGECKMKRNGFESSFAVQGKRIGIDASVSSDHAAPPVVPPMTGNTTPVMKLEQAFEARKT
ncbi:MAG: hypothetical protein JWL63_164 [Rhodocyclales bacterium]|nr:hypothetical protein [Rhodocyclales bacterium]